MGLFQLDFGAAKMSYSSESRNDEWNSDRPRESEERKYDGPAGMDPDGVIASHREEICEDFADMNLREELLRGIYAYGFEKPSAIQSRAIVPCIKGMDVIAQAQSGTGKTATFSIAILEKIDTGLRECQALILAPTRELAQQIQKVVMSLGDYMGAQCHACIGGTSVRGDMGKLDQGQHIVVGTPGRVFDMISRKVLRVNDIKQFVLDEADEMLSRGQGSDLRRLQEPQPGDPGHPLVCHHARRGVGGDHQVHEGTCQNLGQERGAYPRGYQTILHLCREGRMEVGHLVRSLRD